MRIILGKTKSYHEALETNLVSIEPLLAAIRRPVIKQIAST